MVSTSSPSATPRPLRSLLLWTLAATLAAGCNEGERAAPQADAPTSPSEQDEREGDHESADKADALPAAAELLAASVEALGGADKLGAIRSYHAVSKIEIEGQGITGVAHTWWRDGDFYVETDISGVGKMRLGSDKGTIWNDDPINGPRTITGVEAEQSAWSTSRSLPLDWEKYFKSAETTEITEIDGTQVAVITFTSESGDEVLLRIDMATKMPHSQSFKQANPLGAMPVTVTFADFREVEGTKVAFKQLVDATLTKMTSVNEEFEVNVEIKDELFAQPGPKAIKLPEEAAEQPDKPESLGDQALADAAAKTTDKTETKTKTEK